MEEAKPDATTIMRTKDYITVLDAIDRKQKGNARVCERCSGVTSA